MADLIMAIGFSVDYTAHISYHYYASGLTRGRRITRAQRMHNTLAHVMYPMLQVRLFSCAIRTLLTFAGKRLYSNLHGTSDYLSNAGASSVRKGSTTNFTLVQCTFL